MNSLSSWYWRSLALKNRTGSEIFEQLFMQPSPTQDQLGADYPIATLLESPDLSSLDDHNQLCRYSICAGAPRQVGGKLQLWTPSRGQILPFLRQLLDKKTDHINFPAHLPFTGGWLGWLGYDLAWEIEDLPLLKSDRLPFPVAYWYEPESFAILDHQTQILWLASTTEIQLEQLTTRLESSFRLNTNLEPLIATDTLSFITNQNDYEYSVKKAKEYIKQGDIFQANISLRFKAISRGNSWNIYRGLQKINPSPFASYWQTPWGIIVSCSPERLVKLEGDQAQTRPIAGTRARGENKHLDQQLETELISNVKERAEHIMLVDLERNDLGKVCTWGSVKVDQLLTIEKYSHVMHLVSNICGEKKANYDAVDLIRALFPGGTITGCPKVRCMEIIEELEPVRRNLFYGSCGYLDHRGNLDLNILIRTLLLTEVKSNSAIVWGQVGAGIVADSEPEKEWLESLHKAKAQLMALQICPF